MKLDLNELSLAELKEQLKLMDEPVYRAEQIWHWLYDKGTDSFSGMKNLATELKHKLEQRFYISRPKISVKQKSVDGTIKWLLKLEDEKLVETVFIPESRRGTL